eukprot:scaffold10923_cov35-Phaeocystis_antarctica.AAC.1
MLLSAPSFPRGACLLRAAVLPVGVGAPADGGGARRRRSLRVRRVGAVGAGTAGFGGGGGGRDLADLGAGRRRESGRPRRASRGGDAQRPRAPARECAQALRPQREVPLVISPAASAGAATAGIGGGRIADRLGPAPGGGQAREVPRLLDAELARPALVEVGEEGRVQEDVE